MNKEFIGRRMVILGLARQGTALARYLVERGANVVVSDLRPVGELQEALSQLAGLPIELALGGHPSSLLEGAELIFLSGGVPTDAPIVRQAVQRGIPLSNDSQLFLTLCPATVIGITGSAGKTTTTALTGEMCKSAGRQTLVGGNIGRSMLPDLERIQAGDLVVMELSSFQLEIMTVSTQVAAVLNLTPNHLDRHKTMEAYTAAKARLLAFQTGDGVAVLGKDDPVAWGLRSLVPGRLREFSLQDGVEDGVFLRGEMITLRGLAGEQHICRSEEIALLGRHNVLNVLAAAALADTVGIPVEAIAEVAGTFKGVEHRLEWVREYNQAQWYDDSIATAPERLMAALHSFEAPLILLAGGRDKDLPWTQAAALIGKRVRGVVLFGEAADMIRGQLEEAKAQTEEADWNLAQVVTVSTLEMAVQEAARLTRPGDVVLLSPGGTSFDAFVDFTERGDRFKDLVNAL